ncbi:MAG: hypothetical protein Kow00124_06200 [Anaerolineae bacterium]
MMTVSTDKTGLKKIGAALLKVMRAPFFALNLLVGSILTVIVLASVTVGAWADGLLRLIGIRMRPHWLPAALGVVGYLGLGIALPAYLGSLLIGWPGAMLAPLLVLAGVVILGRW